MFHFTSISKWNYQYASGMLQFKDYYCGQSLKKGILGLFDFVEKRRRDSNTHATKKRIDNVKFALNPSII